ncbi:hypothetical protein N7491_002003 [Penicillium cf. griseofulvum]|uniref:Mid2 domain-containing protein n=1 Tax=Penicillium cf. griseofulvum TaxID=2972120 RepID=A0A9W9T2S7_9EURO|nr:hypothetical protein N7472_003812 [Penicillium cf. griseofulvum]KAJ5445921.1 hypothetical protein N7491_002003 [Penicillium cf. griseofulvum]
MEEAPDYTTDDLNITSGTYTIETSFPLADIYLLRFIYGNNACETGPSDITISELPKNASDTSSSTSLVEPTPRPSVLTPLSTGSARGSATGTNSLAQEANSSSGSEAVATATESPKTNENNDDGLNTVAKVGIGIGCSAAAIIGMLGLFILYRFKKKSKIIPEQSSIPPSDVVIKMELDGSSAARRVFEMHGKHEAANLPELPSHPFVSSELPG